LLQQLVHDHAVERLCEQFAAVVRDTNRVRVTQSSLERASRIEIRPTFAVLSDVLVCKRRLAQPTYMVGKRDHRYSATATVNVAAPIAIDPMQLLELLGYVVAVDEMQTVAFEAVD
jgi:hypothetical protein